MNFKSLPEFEKEMKKAVRKYVTLEEDIEEFKRVLPCVDFDNNKRFKVLTMAKGYKIIKTNLVVRCLKGSGKTRLIFAFAICGDEVTFLELYFKMNKEREDEGRIEEFLKQTE